MTKYDITIEGHETGLSSSAIQSMVENMFPHADTVSVVEDGADRE